jgi:hypothetical protein
MTTGTVLAFIVTGIIVLVAVVGGIWLETRLPGAPGQRRSPPGLLGQRRPQAMVAGGHRSTVAEAPRGALPPGQPGQLGKDGVAFGVVRGVVGDEAAGHVRARPRRNQPPGPPPPG